MNTSDDLHEVRHDDPRFAANWWGAYRPRWIARDADAYFPLLYSTTPCNRQKAAESIAALYASMDEPRPQIIWAPSPVAALQIAITAAWCHATREQLSPSTLSSRARHQWIRRIIEIMSSASLSELVHHPRYRPGDPHRSQTPPSSLLCRDIMRACRAVISPPHSKDNAHHPRWQSAIQSLLREVGQNTTYTRSIGMLLGLSKADFCNLVEQAVQAFGSSGLVDVIDGGIDNSASSDLAGPSWLGPVLFNFGHCDTLALPLPGEILDASFSPERHRLQLAAQTVSECGIWWPLKGIAIVSERPSEIHLDASNRFHAHGKMAIKYSDGFGFYALRGIRVPKDIAMGNFRARHIDRQPNIELRRAMIEMFGVTNYLRDTGAKVVHRDSFGVLYEKRMTRDEPIAIVEVENKTPEPDGSYRTYFLRVPPDMCTAREAVAWTFRMAENLYQPCQES